MLRRIFLISLLVAALLGLATAAHAGLAALSYTDTNSESVTVGPAQRYINPTGEVSVYLTGGLERKVGYVLLDTGGHTVAEAMSDGVITGSDQFTVLGQTYYGKILTIPAGLSEGDYTLKARIFDSQGAPVSSQDIALTVDLTPPETGDLWWNAYQCDYSIMNNELVGKAHSKYIKVLNVSDAIGIGRVQFESFYPDSGEVYTSKPAWYDSASQTAGIGTGVDHCIGTNYLPAIDGPLGVRFIVYDRAGNKTVAQATVRYNGIHTPLPEKVAVYNPNVTTEFIPGSGLVGYEPYTEGMTVYTNPIKLLYRVQKTNWVDYNPDYGLNAVNGEVIYTDDQYVYVRFTVPHGTSNSYSWRFNSPKYWNVGYVTYNLVLADTAPQSPVFVSWQIYRDDSGWQEPKTGYMYYLWNEPYTVSKIKVIAEPRDYDQTFVINSLGTCTIPAGETECSINTNIYADPGTIKLYHSIAYIKNADNLRSSERCCSFRYDLQPPSITSYDWDRGNKTVTFLADEPNAGEMWGTVKLASGWIMAHNSVTGEDVKINGTVTALGGTTYQIDTNYASLPEGNWQFTLWVRDNFGNTDDQSAETVVLDQTAPQVTVLKDAAPLVDHEEVASLGQITFVVADNVDQVPEVTGVQLSGGPQGDTVSLAYRRVGASYALEYPVMFPSQGQEYNLSVSARDASGNAVTRTVAFSYAPPQMNLSSHGHETLNLPAIPANVRRSDGRNALVSEVIKLGGSPISGTYDLLVVSGSSSTTSVVVNGMVLAPGEQKTLPAYDFASTGGRLDLPIRAETPGKADILVTSAAPNFPVLTASLNFWRPELQLSADPGWEVQPIIQTQRINLVKGSGTPCRLTLSEQEAQAADPIDDPVCLIQWAGLPDNYQTTAEYAEGVMPPSDNYRADYEAYVYNGGQRYQVGGGGHALETVPIYGVAFSPQVSPAGVRHYWRVQKIDVKMESSGTYRCPLIVEDPTQAQSLGTEQVVCLWRWTSVPDGMESYLQATSMPPRLTGVLNQYGAQDVAWSVDIYSPYGMLEDVAGGSLSLSAVYPPVPALTFEPGLYGEKVEDGLFVTSELQGGEVGAVKFGTELLQTEMTLELEGTDEGRVEKRYWSANNITFSRYIRTGPLSVWQSKPVTARLYYTALPEVAVEKQILVMGVPSKRIRAMLSAPKEALDTAGVPVKLAVGLPAPGGEVDYTAEQHGEWRGRFGYLDRQNQFHPLTEFQALQNGVLETTLTGFGIGFQKLMAEVELMPPPGASFYNRTMSSNAVYAVVLKGTAPEGRIFSRTLSGPAPLTSVMSLQVDSDSRRVMGDVLWQMSTDGGDRWQDIESRKNPYQAAVTVNAGRYLVRAKMKNRLSGAEGYSEGVEIIAYQVPELLVSAPSAVIVGTPVTLQAQVMVDGQPQADAVVEWYNRARELVHTGSSLEMTPTETESLIYQVRARLASAPETDSSAWVRGTAYVRVLPPSPPRGIIMVPSYLEYNTTAAQTYHLSAKVKLAMGLDPAMYPVRGEWHLPDGRVVEGSELEYSPTAADAEKQRALFEYVAWIEGFKDQTSVTLRRSVWVRTYDWPEFRVDVRTYPEVAPALVTLTAVPETGRPSDLERPTYTWHLPPAAEVIRELDKGRVMRVKFPEPGSHAVTVDIEDARGSTAQATATVVLGEPEPFQVEFQPLYSNPEHRELLDIVLRTRVTGGHPQDRLVDYQFTVDSPDAEVTGYSGTGIIKGLRAGEYVAHLKATSKLGEVVEVDFPISVGENRLPTCTVDAWDDALGYRWYKAACSDPDGRIAGYRWYLDEQLISSGRTIRYKKDENTGTLRFEARDDAGGVYRETFSAPTG